MAGVVVGSRVRVKEVPVTVYADRVHNRNAGRTGTVTQTFSCPSTVLVKFDTVEYQNGYPVSSCLYSPDLGNIEVIFPE